MTEQAVAEAVANHLARGDAGVNRLLGLTVEQISPGRATCRLVVREELLNIHSVCHGGLVFALADTALAYASSSKNRAGMTQSASIVFTRAARLGDVLLAAAAVESDGRRTSSCTVRVSNQHGHLVALVQASSLRLDGPVLPPPRDDVAGRTP